MPLKYLRINYGIIYKKTGLTSKNIIVEADVANVSKEKRYRILKTFAKGIKAS